LTELVDFSMTETVLGVGGAELWMWYLPS